MPSIALSVLSQSRQISSVIVTSRHAREQSRRPQCVFAVAGVTETNCRSSSLEFPQLDYPNVSFRSRSSVRLPHRFFVREVRRARGECEGDSAGISRPTKLLVGGDQITRVA